MPYRLWSNSIFRIFISTYFQSHIHTYAATHEFFFIGSFRGLSHPWTKWIIEEHKWTNYSLWISQIQGIPTQVFDKSGSLLHFEKQSNYQSWCFLPSSTKNTKSGGLEFSEEQFNILCETAGAQLGSCQAESRFPYPGFRLIHITSSLIIYCKTWWRIHHSQGGFWKK